MEYLIACLIPLLVMLGRTIYWFSMMPTKRVHGIGIKYLGKVTNPWNGLEETIEAVVQTLRKIHGIDRVADIMTRVHVRVVPSSYKLKNTKACHVCGPSQTELWSSIESHRFLPFFPEHHVINIIQNDDAKDDAGKSMLFHSFSQHLIALKTDLGLNAGHSNAALDELHRLFKRTYWRK